MGCNYTIFTNILFKTNTYIDLTATKETDRKKIKAYNVLNDQTGGVHVPVTAKRALRMPYRKKKTYKTSFLPLGNRTAALLYNNDTAVLFPPTRGNRHTGLLPGPLKMPVQYSSLLQTIHQPKLAGL